MIITLPPQPHLAATLAAGPMAPAPNHQGRYALILKGAYLLAEPEDTGIRALIPDPDPTHAAIGFADDPGTGQQSDLALGKEYCDIAVAGWLRTPAANSRGMHGHIRVNTHSWFTRSVTAATELPGDADAAAHLFGWQPRSAPPRALNTDENSEETTLPADYTLGFENFHRRSPNPTPAGHSPIFDAETARLRGAVPAGSEISISQWEHAAPGELEQLRVRTPATLALTAQLRAWCGHGPDRARHWKIVDRLSLRCDTLIIYPAAQRAALLWRCAWDAQLVPPPHWRKVQVLEGSA